jgi:hypothetical protein
MRSIKEFKKGRFLGKWITTDCWVDEGYYCVGESDEYLFVWYGTWSGYGDIKSSIYGYKKDEFSFSVIRDDISVDNRKTSWCNVNTFEDLEISLINNIKWIK